MFMKGEHFRIRHMEIQEANEQDLLKNFSRSENSYTKLHTQQ